MLRVWISAINNVNYSSSAEITVSAYNEDSTFAGAKAVNVILPPNKTSKFAFDVIGSGSIKVNE